MIKGETNIDIPKAGQARSPIKNVWVEPTALIHKPALNTLLDADVIVIGPGDLYTSLIPNFLVSGVPDAIRRSKAVKIYICNLMTKFGETESFSAEDFVKEVERYLGKNILDFVLCNIKKPAPSILREYKKEISEFVAPPSTLVYSLKKPKYILEDIMCDGALVRHNPKKLAKTLLSLV